ncbi:MAG: hypothetical protein AAF705_16025 [Bacteroidota bacterium]
MNKKWKIILGILGGLVIATLWFLYTPVDLRPTYLGNKIAEKDFEKGKVLLKEMQDAYGGMDKWLTFKTGKYEQIADWYEDKFGIAGWDALPQ